MSLLIILLAVLFLHIYIIKTCQGFTLATDIIHATESFYCSKGEAFMEVPRSRKQRPNVLLSPSTVKASVE